MSTNPYRIDGPALVSFSGGRTSGYMLNRILDAWGGQLPQDVHVVFANTGKEKEQTLEFVRECAQRFGQPYPLNVRWLERRARGPVLDSVVAAVLDLDLQAAEERDQITFAEVNFDTASRAGEPFETLITERNFLPNPVTRYCTTELKIRVMKAFMLGLGYKHWTNIVGLRADEPFRLAKQRARTKDQRWDLSFPLADAGVRKSDVVLWWKKQPFDLQLRSWEGNCDLCYLKGVAKRSRIIEDHPEAAAWWTRQEARMGAPFRHDTPSYAGLVERAQRQTRMFPNSAFPDPDAAEDLTHLDECGGYCEAF